ncbi:hypothetical protein [Sphingobacterium multivorum]|uniref:Lipoprotein n=1 Tax=Sphingobacterium multivorum TaxID=28454 RepID=A0A2X2LGL1_SPHMU|nr:hypothetical protein [Sphingobacterium multivorum]QRQ62222.1 hypothetical protein I6J33_04310 [Sphingobacterium multivorum]SPZ92409.1 Uncharacterised protein [Sphingobacterium multivorum]
MMNYKTIIIGLGFCSLAGCATQKENIGNRTERESVSLAEGQRKSLREYPIKIKFNGISEDSRCPEGVNCIWSGVAVAEIEIVEKATKPTTIKLATIDLQDRGYQRTANTNGYTISLQDIVPYPNKEQGTQTLRGNYKIAVIVQKTVK